MVMDVHPSGYYAWKKHPLSEKMSDDQRLLGLLKQAWLESGCVYGYRKLTLDMRDLGERCGTNTASPDCCAARASIHRRATGVAQVVVVANLPWWPPTT